MQGTFKIGDKAVYPAQGVTEIMGIESRDICGNQEIFYVLKVLDTQKRIMVPVSKVSSVGLREVIGGPDVSNVYEVLREKQRPIDTQTWNRRFRKYVEKIKSGSLFDVAEVLRDLSLARTEKPLSCREREMLEMARRLLVKELSIAENSDEENVTGKLTDIFGADPEPANKA
ncbi:MAG: CarD family transcriptional regulator [Myxococcales bacterium]|jgi:CarD family transcriptional regulator|nr:CarD family transcriptional regulator [Myxococcales bacterium]